ncbi:MAG TPA: T9SS type A sorting domain-containing protein, partial [Calditrichia bacterium]|nr:T9SS type A sorting domain-containing protein [Calditrichia bacterium]
TNTGSGSYPGEIFRVVAGNLWIKDLILVGYVEAIPGEIGNIPSGLIRVDGVGFDIEIYGSLLSQNRGQHIRTEGGCRVIRLVDNVIANMGDLGRSNFGAGKAVDVRGTSCDSLIFINNTFVNFQDRIIRHRSSTGAIGTLIFDHNTLVNGMSFHGTLALGWVGNDVSITNNLFLDTFVAGNDTDATRMSEFNESGEVDQYGLPRMNWIFTVPNDSTQYRINNNFYSVSAPVQDFYNRHAAAGVTGEGAPLTYHINGKLGADSTTAFVKELITPTLVPEVMIAMADWYRDPNGGNKTKNTANFNRDTDDFDRRPMEFYRDSLDVSYPNTTAAYSGAERGFPAGDLNWYPALKDLWSSGGSVGIEPGITGVATDFRLEQNYPNPFNPSTKIEFSMRKAADVRLEIYNVTGQKVATLVDRKLAVGSYEMVWEAKNIPSGVYFYTLKSEAGSQTRKMILMK